MTAMIFGEIYRYNGEWKFGAIGQGTRDGGIGEMASKISKIRAYRYDMVRYGRDYI